MDLLYSNYKSTVKLKLVRKKLQGMEFLKPCFINVNGISKNCQHNAQYDFYFIDIDFLHISALDYFFN
ncbi:hypothetical protein HYD82_02450 [Mycoplasmopsis bovis]|nr:hypothetical protein [Mycoplasmopsis bovis]QQH37590.1 hypothetical protein HYD82_02450 [Mycoplasmopsis bovis]